MEFDEYQDLTEETAIYPRENEVIWHTDDGEVGSMQIGLMYTVLGLTGEAGEVSEKVKKYIRENDDEYIEELEKEIGDVLWYLARLTAELDLSLDDVAEQNLEKLLDRYERDKIEGSGDNR